MKTTLKVGLALLALVAVARCQEAPLAQITFKVITDDRTPVAGVIVGMSTFVRWQPGDGFGKDIHDGPTAVTGKNGVVVLSYPSKTGEFGYQVRDLEGYYRDRGNDYRFTEQEAGRWQPWNPTIEIVFRKIEKPIAMYAKKVDLAMPAFEVPVGFDLVIGEWVAPYGKGKTSDLVFTAHLQQRSKKDYDYELAVTFSNAEDGLQPFEAPPFYGSELKSPRLAPENGYLPEWKQWRKRAPGKAEASNVSESRNYLFRVRTVLDDKGKLVSALYGKIYGDFLRFTYYLNSTANDRNIEFDPKQSLYEGLRETERVREP